MLDRWGQVIVKAVQAYAFIKVALAQTAMKVIVEGMGRFGQMSLTNFNTIKSAHMASFSKLGDIASKIGYVAEAFVYAGIAVTEYWKLANVQTGATDMVQNLYIEWEAMEE